MPTVSDFAICLRQWDWSETSQTVRLLTREHGTIRGLAKGARRERGAFSGGFEVLTRGQLVAITKPGRDLATLTEWRLLEVFPAIRRRLDANRAGLLIADLLAHLLTDGDPHPDVYDAAIATLQGFESPDDAPMSLLRFQWTLLDAIGVAPRVDADVIDGEPLDDPDPDGPPLSFRPNDGGFRRPEGHAPSADPARHPGWGVRPATFRALRDLAARRPHDPHHPHDTIDRANRLLAAYARHVAGRELPALDWAFGPAPGDGRTAPPA